MTEKSEHRGQNGHNRYRRLVWGVLIVSLLATGFFATRGVVQVIYWSDPRHHNQAIEPWMPLGFIARSYDIDKEELTDELGLSPDLTGRRSVESLAAAQGRSFDDMAHEIETAIAVIRAR